MTTTKQTAMSADLWRDAEDIRGYAADPGQGQWVTMAQAQAHATAVQQPLRARITELEAQMEAAYPSPQQDAAQAMFLKKLVGRIKATDEASRAAGHVGLFLTLTCPNRFHTGNASFDGSTPRDATAWLRAMWARTRAELARRGVRMHGLRISEPHDDGCPHWHAMLWFESSAAVESAMEVFRKHWLRDEGDETGARHRVSDTRLGGACAASYVSKYVGKGYGFRQTAWAKTWGVRQFQAIGALSNE